MNQLLQANFIYPLKSKNHIFHTKTKIFHEFIFSSYTVCIRRIHGFCCVQYQVCETGGFSLDGNSAIANTADTGIVCTTDYIDIQGKTFLIYITISTLMSVRPYGSIRGGRIRLGALPHFQFLLFITKYH